MTRWQQVCIRTISRQLAHSTVWSAGSPRWEKRARGHYFIPQALPLTNRRRYVLSRPVGRADTVH